MIVFLTLCYVAALAVAIKIGIVKLTMFWKLSPIAWMLLLFLLLFLPMQWGAPGGKVIVFRPIVEIVPNVTGEVVEVPVEPLVPLEPGDVLFRIDPLPFQAVVDRLQAQLAAATQNVEQLKASAEAAEAAVTKSEEEIDVKKADIKAAAARVIVAETSVAQAETGLDKSTILVVDLKVQVAAGKREFERQKELLAEGAGSRSDLDRAEVQSTGLISQLNTAESDLRFAEQSLTGSRASLDAEKAAAHATDIQLKQLVDADLPRAKAVAREAKLAAESMIGDEHTGVAVVRAQLVSAQYDLEQTTVRAPSKGMVAYVSLRPGQRVASFPMRSWMAFVDTEETEIAVAVQQYALRNVHPGQQAEVTFKVLPGRVFNATVNRIAYANASGQLQPSGQLRTIDWSASAAEPYGVVIEIEDESFDASQLSSGASGSAAIYTESMQATHVIRKVMIRMDAWTNYVVP